MGGACLVAALPTLVWALTATHSSEPLDFSFTTYLYTYFPYHSFAHLEIWLLLSYAALAATVWMVAQCFVKRGETHTAATLLLASLITILLGSLSSYAVDYWLVLNLYPMRYAAVGHWLAAIAVIVLWAQAEQRQSSSAAFGAIAVSGFLLPTPAVTILGLVLMLQGSEVTRPRLAILLLGLAVT
jgi:hypothetical protein